MKCPTFNAYLIINTENDKRYVGITTKPVECRWRDHVKQAKRQTAIYPLQAAILKHGEASFRIEHVACAASWADLLELERALISQFQTFARHGGGYNATLGGVGPLGSVHTPESRARRSEMLRNAPDLEARIAPMLAAVRTHKRSDEHNANNATARRGKTLSAQARANMSAAHVGKKQSAEAVAKTAAANRGRPCSEATRLKISAARKGKAPSPRTIAAAANSNRKPTPEAIEARAAGIRGKPKSAAHRAAISAAHKGKVLTMEHRAKLSAARRRRSKTDFDGGRVAQAQAAE